MLNKWIAGLIGLSLPLVASADPFTYGEATPTPHVKTIDYNWTAPAVSGSQTFTFSAGTLRTNTRVCTATSGCVNGTFTTSNTGSGVYRTRVPRVNFGGRVAAGCTFNGSFWGFQSWTCPVQQNIRIIYDVTDAEYLGDADWGTVDYIWWFGIEAAVNNHDDTFSGSYDDEDLYFGSPLSLNGDWNE